MAECNCDQARELLTERDELRESIKRLAGRVFESEAEIHGTMRVRSEARAETLRANRARRHLGLRMATDYLTRRYQRELDMDRAAHYLARLRRVERLLDIHVGARA